MEDTWPWKQILMKYWSLLAILCCISKKRIKQPVRFKKLASHAKLILRKLLHGSLIKIVGRIKHLNIRAGKFVEIFFAGMRSIESIRQ
jgi:hypothetical protein